MKKNKMMRVASALLVAVLMTTSVISGTFAKYVTQDSASDEARVAKWGVVLQVVGNLYGENYFDAENGNTSTSGTTNITVDSVNDPADDVVAPGTKNDEGFKIAINGTPEVSTRVSATIKAQNIFLDAGTYGVMVPVAEGVVTEDNFTEFTGLYKKVTANNSTTFEAVNQWIADTDFYTLEDEVNTSTLSTYYPVVYAMTGGNGDITYSGDDSKDTINAIAAEIAKAIKGSAVTGQVNEDTKVTTYEAVSSTVIAPNANLAEELDLSNIKITWAWAIGTANTLHGVEPSVKDKADTILGLLMAGTPDVVVNVNGTYTTLTVAGDLIKVGDTVVACLKTSFDISITVEQVD